MPIKLRRLLRISLLCLLLFFVGMVTFITVDGLTNTSTPCELGVVLGNKVHPSGRMSVALRKRMEQAMVVWNGGLVDRLMVSGGLGKEGHDEAIVMRDYLLKMGVPRDKIIVDSQGLDTRLTSLHAKETGAESVIVITNYFHISRAKLACRQAGIPVVHGSAPIYFHWTNLWSVPREVIGWWAYLLRLK